MPGVGKTAFAVHAANELAARFPSGQLFVPLHAHSRPQGKVDAGDILGALLRATGMDARRVPTDIADRELLWKSRLAGRRILLILDDVASAEQVESVLPTVAGCAVLITSRRRLAVLEGAIPVSLSTFRPTQAARLFRKLANRPRGEQDAIAEVVSLAGYLPLAIRLLAGRLRHHPTWTVSDLAEYVAAARDRSAAIGAVDEPISAAFDLSYNLLPEHRQEFFRRLGLNPGLTIDHYAAAALTERNLDTTRREMEALFVDHLIDEPAPGHFRFHDLIGDYSRALASTDPAAERRACIDRLLGYSLDAAQSADVRLAKQSRTTAVDRPNARMSLPDLSTALRAREWIEAERTNLQAIVQYASEHGHPKYAVAIPAAMGSFLGDNGPWDQALLLHSIALASARSSHDHHGEAGALHDLGAVRRLKGEYDAASDDLNNARDIYVSLGDIIGEATAMSELGMIERLTGRNEAALMTFSRSVDLFVSVGDEVGEANALCRLGIVQFQKGQSRNALKSEEKSLSLYRNLASQPGEALALNYVGLIQSQTGNHRAGAETLRTALALYRSIGDRTGEAAALSYLGDVDRLSGDYSEAERSLKAALEIFEMLGDHLGQAGALYYLGFVQCHMSDYRSAASNEERALIIYRELGEPLGEANALHYLGVVENVVGDQALAEAHVTKAIDMFRELGNRYGEAEALNSLGDIWVGRRQTEESRQCYEKALAIARQIDAAEEEARALEGLGQCAILSNRFEDGTETLRAALEIYRRIESPYASRVEGRLHAANSP
jgi:tetratricopeptide (TPR) repeat protein